MKTFWLEFELSESDYRFYALKLGCGITAFDYTDAMQIIQERIFKGTDIPKIRKVVENIKFSELDTNHVIPNMKPIVFRGVWFPLGYD